MSTTTPEKPSPFQAVVLNKAFKLVKSHSGPNTPLPYLFFLFPLQKKKYIKKEAIKQWPKKGVIK